MGATNIITLLLLLLPPILADYPEVILNLGVIHGSYMTTFNDRQFSAFRGIPYAKPPIGDLRFKPPQKLTDSLSPQPFDASKDGMFCSQFDLFTGDLTGVEDCLILNVYTPQITQDNETFYKLPVIVYIHGGGFTYGSSISTAHGPKKILDHDVILVTFNYRLHVLGFLSTSDDSSPGNYGLLDQVEVLKWVQENIHSFGGDPDKVTLAGSSAGAASVGYHLLSNLSTGLFNAAIEMSGNPLGSWAYDDNPHLISREYGLKLGCNDTDFTDVVECLRKIPINNLLTPLVEFSFQSFMPFRPTTDGYFLTDNPLNLHKKQKFQKGISIMTGIVEFEGITFYGVLRNKFSGNFDDALLQAVKFCLNSDNDQYLNNASEMIKNLYFQSIDAANSTEFKHKLIQLLGDCSITVPYYYALNSYVNSGGKVYAYTFDYVSNRSVMALLFGMEDLVGATHGDDFFFLFDSPMFIQGELAQKNDATENKFLELWVNFAKYGNPTPGDEEHLPNWLPSNNDDVQILHLDDPITLQKFTIDHNLTDFWFKDIL